MMCFFVLCSNDLCEIPGGSGMSSLTIVHRELYVLADLLWRPQTAEALGGSRLNGTALIHYYIMDYNVVCRHLD